jgi:hypothetical protein
MPSSTITFIRWVAFLPCAAAAALFAGFVMRLFQKGIMRIQDLNPDGFLNHLWLEVISSGVIGVAFVYVGARIAPKNRKTVGYVLTVTAILIAGFFSFPAIMQKEWWSLVGCISIAIGASIAAYSISDGVLDHID